jgi:DNA-binding beta-propeller fold protein YncE
VSQCHSRPSPQNPSTVGATARVVALCSAFAGCVLWIDRPCDASAVYWSDIHNGTINRASGPGAPHSTVVPDAGRPWGVAIDPVNNRLYWGDDDPSTAPKIMSAKLDGSDRSVVLAEAPVSGGGSQLVQDLALDVVNHYVYYTEGNTRTLRRVRTDGSGDEVLVNGRLNGPVDVKLDVANGYMYWTQIVSTDSEIYRAKLDGSDPELLFSDRGFYYDLALAPDRSKVGGDYDGRYIYFADQHPNYQAIRRISINGDPSPQIIAHVDGMEPSGLEIDPDGHWLYFSRRDQPGIWRTKLDGSGLQEVVNPAFFPDNAYTIDFTLEHTALFAAGLQVPEPAPGGMLLAFASLGALRRRRR